MSYSFDMQRSIVRDATYANRRAEDEAIKATDKRIFAQVRAHERQLRRQSERHVADALAIRRKIERLEAAIHAEITEPFERSAVTEEPVSLAESAQRYTTLAFQVDAALAELSRKEFELSWVEDKLVDPYNDLDRLLMKFFDDDAGVNSGLVGSFRPGVGPDNAARIRIDRATEAAPRTSVVPAAPMQVN